MPNGTYGGVRGKETKIGQKTFVSRPTRLDKLKLLLGRSASGKVPLAAVKNVEASFVFPDCFLFL